MKRSRLLRLLGLAASAPVVAPLAKIVPKPVMAMTGSWTHPIRIIGLREGIGVINHRAFGGEVEWRQAISWTEHFDEETGHVHFSYRPLKELLEQAGRS